MASNSSRKRRTNKQKGGCGLKPLSPALIGGKKSKRGGVSSKLAAVGFLGTLLAFGKSKKSKSKTRKVRKTRRVRKFNKKK